MAIDFRASQFRGAKFIASGSTGTGASLVFYPIAADSTTNPNIGNIDTAKFGTGSIGTDIFLFVSGGVGQRGTSTTHAVSVFGGDVVVSGNMYVTTSLYVGEFGNNNAVSTNAFFVSGTVNKIPQGANQRNSVFASDVIMSGTLMFRSSSASPMNFIIGGNGDSGVVFSGSLITIGVAGNTSAGHESVFQVTALGGSAQVPAVANKDVIFVVSGNVDGQGQSGGGVSLFKGDVVVSGNLYLGAGKKFTQYITIGSYASTTLTSSNPQVAGQAVISQSEIPSSSIILRSVLSTTTGSVSASLKLFNVTSGSYVEIGGAGITTLGTVSTTPTQIQSVNLFSATNFGTGSNIYEVQVYIGTGSQQAVLGSSMFICR
jgi:hypothetical protein